MQCCVNSLKIFSLLKFNTDAILLRLGCIHAETQPGSDDIYDNAELLLDVEEDSDEWVVLLFGQQAAGFLADREHLHWEGCYYDEVGDLHWPAIN